MERNMSSCTKRKGIVCVRVFLLMFFCATAAANDFPTSARAEYVFACMSSNGQSQEMLGKCSCSIDAIAEFMSYDEYVQAETIVRMRRLPGERMAMFRDAEWVNKAFEKLQVAQVEAESRCF